MRGRPDSAMGGLANPKRVNLAASQDWRVTLQSIRRGLRSARTQLVRRSGDAPRARATGAPHWLPRDAFCVGTVRVLYCYCTGTTPALCWCCAEALLALYWCGTTTELKPPRWPPLRRGCRPRLPPPSRPAGGRLCEEVEGPERGREGEEEGGGRGEEV